VSEITEDRARPPVPGSRDLVGEVLPGEAATLRAVQEALDGRRTGLKALWPFLGPAFIASVA
jgi:manganese transport protein